MTNLDSILKSRDITLPTKVCLVKAKVFPVVRYGCELDYKESWPVKNCSFWTVVLEKTLESPLDCKEIHPVHSEGDQPWDFFGRNDQSWSSSTLATWWEQLTCWKRPWLGMTEAGGEGDDRGWDGWMASLTWWAWVWASSRSWWWTGRPGVLQSMGSQSRTQLVDWTDMHIWASLVAQMVKNLPVRIETWVQSLGWEDPLEEGRATHSSILAWRIPMDRRT